MFGLAITLLLGFFLRTIGLNWDQGMHLHPDERMLIMVADRLHFFNNLDPDFFNYGSLPVYLLRAVAQIRQHIFPSTLSLYDLMLPIGRALSLVADMVIIFVIHKVSWKLFKSKQISYTAPLLYAISFFPIQNTHFFIVDTFLNLFLLLTIYALIRFLEHSSLFRNAMLALCFAAALSTKITAIIFLPFIACLVLIHKRKNIFGGIIDLLSFSLFVLMFSFVMMPFAFLDWSKFIADVSSQVRLASDPYVFPYTLQYVGTTAYFYYLKNILLWGLGPVLSILSVVGFVALIRRIPKTSYFLLLFLAFYCFYFVIIGRSSVKFMRYMLPLYPFLSILAAYGLEVIRKKIGLKIVVVLIAISFIWMLAFNSIYLKEHTRISATNWILENIPQGSTLAVEHWDDRLPIYRSELYAFEELQLYNQPDDATKWNVINNQLSRTDYLIIASNRLYAPLQKLNDCGKFRSCYPITSNFYNKLLSGKSSFKLIKEFVVEPELKISDKGFAFSDQTADESFTVYDHPKILIFQNANKEKSGQ